MSAFAAAPTSSLPHLHSHIFTFTFVETSPLMNINLKTAQRSTRAAAFLFSSLVLFVAFPLFCFASHDEPTNQLATDAAEQTQQ